MSRQYWLICGLWPIIRRPCSVWILWRISIREAVSAGVTAFFGSVLSIKPIIHVKNGIYEPFEKVRSQKQSIQKMIDRSLSLLNGKTPVQVAVIHGDCLELAETLKAKAEAAFGRALTTFGDTTPVVITHSAGHLRPDHLLSLNSKQPDFSKKRKPCNSSGASVFLLPQDLALGAEPWLLFNLKRQAAPGAFGAGPLSPQHSDEAASLRNWPAWS